MMLFSPTILDVADPKTLALVVVVTVAFIIVPTLLFFWRKVFLDDDGATTATTTQPKNKQQQQQQQPTTTTTTTTSKKQLPPCVPSGWMETTKRVTSPQAIWFFAQSAKQLNCTVFQIRLPQPCPVFVVGDPIVARTMLQDATTTKPFTFYRPVDVMAGATNIFSANGERWKHARKAITPAFAKAHIQRMNQVCQDKLEAWIQQRLNVCCETGQALDATEEMVFLTLSIISEAALEYKMTREEAVMFVHEVDLSFREFLVRQGSNPLRASWLGYLFDAKTIRRAHVAVRRGQALGRKILDTYRSNNNRHNNNNKQGSDEDSTTKPSDGSNSNSNKKKGTVIEYIVNNPNYNNDEERIADILVFLVGGHDTTAYTVAWTLLELARHPQELQQVRCELLNLSTNDDRLKCPALDHVIQEAMRLHPVAATYLRQVHRDFDVNDTTMIPKGSVVFITNFIMHRHAQYYHQPDDFKPSRWRIKDDKDTGIATTTATAAAKTKTTSSAPTTATSLAFAPFSLGTRNCVGQALANAELHTVMSRLIMDYDFEVVDPGKAECTLTLKPSGLKLKATKCNNHNSNNDAANNNNNNDNNTPE